MKSLITNRRLRGVLGAVGVFLAALTVYVLTLTPSLSYLSPDGSELATVPYVLGLAHSPGYPLYTWLGFLFSRLLPFGDVAHRINLMSAVLGAMGVSGLYLIIVRLLPGRELQRIRNGTDFGVDAHVDFPKSSGVGRRAIAALAALLFAFSIDFWRQALIAEVYAPNIGLVGLTLLALLHWERTRRGRHFFLFALLFGLSLGMHLSNLGFAPAFALFILLTIFKHQPSTVRYRVSAINSQQSVIGDQQNTPLTQESEYQSKIGNLKSKMTELLSTVLVGLVGFCLGAAQFVWLPLRASALNDRNMLRNVPTTLTGMYNYTLGSFPNFKFAFPLTALPDRLVIYLDLLRQQFGLMGISLGVVGLFFLLFRRPRHYFLLVGMYLVNVWFFIQYSAFDLEVFFIPAHFIWALFIAFGLWGIYEVASNLWGKLIPEWRGVRFLSSVLLRAGILTLSLIPLTRNWEGADFSGDTAINDFYANVWELLPPEAALLTPGGVFGYDAFYWQLVYDTRPDVLLPTLPAPNPSADVLAGRSLYATTRALSGNRGPGALPPDLLARDLWQIPVLLGEQPAVGSGKRQPLVLYHLSTEPPELAAPRAEADTIIDADFGPVSLLGVDLSPSRIESGKIVELTLYWQLNRNQQGVRAMRIETALGDHVLEQHEIGFGLLPRYTREVGLSPGEVIVIHYALVIPSTMQAGNWSFTLSEVGLRGGRVQTVTLGELTVVDEVGTFERWLGIGE